MTKQMLSGVAVKHFQDVGFLRVRDTVPQALVQEARSSLAADIDLGIDPCYRKPDGSAYKMYGLLERGGAYESIIRLPSILNLLAQLIGPDIVYTRNRHNHGSLNRRGDFTEGLHRDVIKTSLLTVIVYLEDVSMEEGPTILIPGSHKWPHVPDGDRGIYLENISYPDFAELADQAVPVLASAGDVLIFEGCVLHTAGTHTSDKTRASMVLAYRAVDELTGVNEPYEVLVQGRNLYRGNIVVPDRCL